MNYSSLLRDSLIPTSSPLRKKSVLNLNTTDTSLRQNDDDAERMERRRNAEIEMLQRDSITPPPSSDKRKSIGGSIAGLSPAQLAEHYANCIKLSAENKINTKNAFSLQLIDYMAMMLKRRDSKMDNFQVASCTLDASTKIYAYRVDSVHTDVLKMAGGLVIRSHKRNVVNEDEDQRDSGGSDRNSQELSSHRRKKSRKSKNTIVSNIESINGKPDLNITMDPCFLRSTGNLSECQPGDCHFLTSLKVLSNCSLMMCSDIPYWDTGDDIGSNDNVSVPLPPIADLSNKSICSVFSQFRFTSWSLDTEQENGESFQIPSASHDDFAFDVNAVPEPIPTCDNDVPIDNFDVPGVDCLDTDDEEHPESAACAAANKSSPAKVIDLRKHLSTSPTEYSYFRAGALDLWAGPSHWKIRPLRQTGGTEQSAGSKKQKSKQKNELIVDFQRKENVCVLAESNRESFMLTKRTLQKVWNAEKNTYPPDIHYDFQHFQQLQIRKLIGVTTDPVPIEDNRASEHDYDNDHDNADCCHNDELADYMDDGGGFCIGQHQDVHTNFTIEGTTVTETFAGDNLVTPPNKVARLFIPYAQRAKKIDMKKLKAMIWDILVDAETHKDITDCETLKVEKSVKFSHLHKILPLHLSPTLAENLSAPLEVVALLHLANEKNLHIEGVEELDDLTITQR